MRPSIYHSVTLFRGASVEEVVRLESQLREEEGIPSSFRCDAFADLRAALLSLQPLVYSRCNRFLFLRGPADSVCVFSNFESGAAGNILGPVASLLGAETFLAYYRYPQLLGHLDCSCHAGSERLHFLLEYECGEQSVRSVGCITDAKGECYTANSGNLLPFEDPRHYAQLDRGLPPPEEAVVQWCKYMGWPHPQSAEFLHFVTSAEVYEFPSVPWEDERRVGKEATEMLLRFPETWG